tara:strand:+ start:200 stop:403 length:204 start_codon:yes stop_codon:yes gene_type:complete
MITESSINKKIMFEKPRCPSKSKNKTHEIGLTIKTKEIHKHITNLFFELIFWKKATIYEKLLLLDKL